jgi:signal transduction histidine kinase
MLKVMFSKLSFRLALLFLVASLAPLVAAAVLSIELMRDSLHEEAEQRHGEVARLVGSFVDVWLDSTKGKLQAFAEVLRLDLAERSVQPGDEVTDADLAALMSVVQPLIDTNEQWSQQAVPAFELEFFQGELKGETQRAPQSKGQFVGQGNSKWYEANSLPDVKQQLESRKGGRSESDLVQQPQQTGIAFCEPNLEVVNGMPTLAMSVAVGEVGSNYGTLVAEVDFTELRQILGQLGSEGIGIRVIDEAGTPLFEYGQLLGDVIESEVPFGRNGWIASVGEQVSQIETPLDTMRVQTALWGTFAAVLAVLLSFGLSIRITRPVRALQHTAEAMGRGDLSARSGLKRHDEIGQLAAAFDHMASALAELDAAKSEFVGNVSHELRTPLTSMRLSVANLLDGVVGPLGEKQERTLSRVQSELDRMIALVAELLELARIEAGAVEPNMERVDLAKLALSASQEYSQVAMSKHVELTVTGEGQAFADSALIKRVLCNLLGNAVKFSPHGGIVTVFVEDATLTVQDQGPGFSVNELEAQSMFEKFQQGCMDGVKNDGVGLGLAIVARLVSLNSGMVRAENRDGSAAVRVTLPAAVESSKS